MPQKNPIEIVDYDPRWPAVFAELRGVIGGALGELALGIEHVGSTSVPGLCAKPIIDMDVVIPSRERLPQVIDAVGRLGYVHQGDIGIAGREAFGRLGGDVPRDGSGRAWPEHYLYVCAADNAELGRHLVFRDALRASPELVAGYGELKRRLAREFRYDRDAYCQAKTQFIVAVLAHTAANRPVTLVPSLPLP